MIYASHWCVGGVRLNQITDSPGDHVSSADITVNLNAPYDNLKIIMSKK